MGLFFDFLLWPRPALAAQPHRLTFAHTQHASLRLWKPASLAAACFALAGHDGATLALALGAGFAALGSVMSFLRLAVK
jgi:DHA2 family multidrug resistance protein-like MFS transporter